MRSYKWEKSIKLFEHLLDRKLLFRLKHFLDKRECAGEQNFVTFIDYQFMIYSAEQMAFAPSRQPETQHILRPLYEASFNECGNLLFYIQRQSFQVERCHGFAVGQV